MPAGARKWEWTLPHSDLSLASVEYFGIEAIGVGEGEGCHPSLSESHVLLSELVLRKAIIMHRCSSGSGSAAGDKKRRESRRSIYVAVCSFVRCVLLPATDKQIKEPLLHCTCG